MNSIETGNDVTEQRFPTIRSRERKRERESINLGGKKEPTSEKRNAPDFRFGDDARSAEVNNRKCVEEA